MQVKLREQSITVHAPNRLILETLSSFADGGCSPAGVERARLVERNGDRLLMEFLSRDGRKMYRTLAEVVLYPHDWMVGRPPLGHAPLRAVGAAPHVRFEGTGRGGDWD